MRNNKRRVVITGIGIIGPLGLTTDQFWKNCLSSTSAVTPIPSHWYDYSNFESGIWAPLPSFNISDLGITRKESLQLDLNEQLALAATLQAIKNADISIVSNASKNGTLSLSNIESSRTGVIIGTGAGGITSLITAQAIHTGTPLNNYSGLNRFNPFVSSMMMPNACSSSIGIKFNLTGLNRTVCSACSSGTSAIGYAFKAIEQGDIDCAICGATEFLGDHFGAVFRSFDEAKTLVKGKDPASNSPFDLNRSGFLFSEGGAAILFLEDLAHALSRKSNILAEIIGFAERFDPFNMMFMEPNGKIIEEMIYDALDEADTHATQIDYINAHGTGTVVNDEIESMLIENIFGTSVWVNSTKSLTGHTLGACGAIEAAVTALSLHSGKIHPCHNLKTPLRNLNFPLKTICYPLEKAISESFAFGGHNSALVLNKYREQP